MKILYIYYNDVVDAYNMDIIHHIETFVNNGHKQINIFYKKDKIASSCDIMYTFDKWEIK